MLRSLLFYLLFYPWTLIAILLALPLSLSGPHAIHRFGILWGRSCLMLAGLKLRVQGTEHIPGNTPAIYVANHQSNFDIPILYAGLPLQFRWMAKQELFRFPLFGLAMKRSGYIPIDRSNRRKAMHSLNLAAEKIRAGTSVIIFPEGTRTPDGRLQEFKQGALLIAAKAGVPVVPVAIHGSFRIQPKGSWRVKSGPLKLVIMPPLQCSGHTPAAIRELTGKVHAQIAANLEGDLQNA